jgi:hypothetical protein
MTPELQRLMNNARVNLPGAIDASIKDELFNTMDQFFKGSNIWQEDIAFETEDAVTTYDVLPSGVATINRLVGVHNADNIPVAGTMRVPGVLVLGRAPTAGQTLTATVALTVSEPASRDDYPEHPDWILAQYNDVLLAGLLSGLMAQIAKPYSNERMAIYNGRKFRAGISRAKVEANHHNLYGGQRWTFPRAFIARRA